MEDVNNIRDSEKSLGIKQISFIAIGAVCAVISLFVYPFIFGVVGVVMGIMVTKEGSRAGLPVIVANIILMGIGLIYSQVILNYTRHFLGI